MKFVYFGSFRLSAEILNHLVVCGFMPAAVVCSPDRPAGRKQVLTAPTIKTLILEKKWPIEIWQPESPPAVSDQLSALGADLFIVMGYPRIIGADILAIPRLGTIGVHPSLLPKYRGASPIQSVLLAGEPETGITLYQMDEKMDHGKIISNFKFPISNEDTNSILEEKCAEVAGKLLVETLPQFMAGKISSQEQDHSQATFTKKFTTADGEVDMGKDKPEIIYNKIRAFTPEPGVWTMNFPGREGVRVKLLAAKIAGGNLVVTKIQPAGKKPIVI